MVWPTKSVVHQAAAAALVLGGVAIHQLLLAQRQQLACFQVVGSLH